MAGMEEDFAMSRKCELTAKGPQVGHKVSHSNIKTKKVQRANLRRVRAVVNGTHQRVRLCTRCLRTNLIEKAS